MAAGFAGKAKMPPIYIILAGSVIQTIGFALLGTSNGSQIINKAQYGYEAIAGFGVGINLASMAVMTPFTVEERDKSVALSALIQFRTMGGAIGLAIVTTVMNNYVKSHLANYLSQDQIGNLLRTTEAFPTLPPDLADTVKRIFEDGYNLQMRVVVGFSAAQIPAALLMWQKKQVVV
ncbi:MAG: hypothetical protein ASARMPRED_004843 [Alectoria sarmentosa]|nr:MAG: hypothetical protein ASARMPRED_004843 [Alectoria sarmentosa]